MATLTSDCSGQRQPAIAVLLIHGIGDISEGSVLASASLAVQRAFRKASPTAPIVASQVEPLTRKLEVKVNKTTLHWRHRQIDLFEFWWAGIPGRIRLRQPLDAFVKFMSLMTSLPLTGAAGAGPRAAAVAGFIGKIQLWLVIALLVSGIGLILESTVVAVLGGDSGAAMYELFSKTLRVLPSLLFSALSPSLRMRGDPPDVAVRAFWDLVSSGFVFTAGTAVLFQAAFVWTLIVFGSYVYVMLPLRVLDWLFRRNRFKVAHAWWRVAAVCCFVWLYFGILPPFAFLSNVGLYVAFTYRNVLSPGAHIWTFVAKAALDLSAVVLFLTLGVAALNILRDVVHYLAPDAQGGLQEHQILIREQLWDVVQHLRDDPRYSRLIFVAHSLGTVILVDMLCQHQQVTGIMERPVDLVTAGSPLRRFVQRLLPGRMDLSDLCKTLSAQSDLRVKRWFNVYRLCDYVGQGLTYRALPRDFFCRKPRKGRSEGLVFERLLRPRYQWPLGHADYWGDSRFLTLVATEVLLPIIDESPEVPESERSG